MKHFNLTSAKELKKLLGEHGLRPKKSMGQYFLISKSFLQKIIQAAGINKQKMVIEIGPGLGTITRKLAQNFKQVIAFEKDKGFAPILKETLQGFNNINVLYTDILNANLSSHLTPKTPYKVVSNLPFYASKPIIQKFLEHSHQPKEMVLLLQKEVAETICARPPKMSLLSAAVQFYAEPEYITTVPRSAFWPQPRVKTAIIKIKPDNVQWAENPENRKRFFRVVRAGFAHPRKQIANNMALGLEMKKNEAEAMLILAGIDPHCRAQTLSVSEWIQLTQLLNLKS